MNPDPRGPALIYPLGSESTSMYFFFTFEQSFFVNSSTLANSSQGNLNEVFKAGSGPASRKQLDMDPHSRKKAVSGSAKIECGSTALIFPPS